ncbi:MAG: DUF1737 domain-containing protein [Erysipelotrichaceae bacterium]|nr:DUF1737 domain-containing protein [Erysipelotrichaceae bacterium]
MEYKVVATSNKLELFARKELENEVKKLIKDGYKPQGGISFTKQEDKFYFIQAMIKE